MKRYRFYSDSPGYRPVNDKPFVENKLPWWCSGHTGDMHYSIIIAYLPDDVRLEDLWPEATDITVEDVTEVTYTSRFPKPGWCK